MLGKYIDALPPAALARILSATTWRVHGYVCETGARDILGHAENWFWDTVTDAPNCRAPDLIKLREAAGDSWLNWPPLLGIRFDHLAEKQGLSRAVELVRQRALRCGQETRRMQAS